MKKNLALSLDRDTEDFVRRTIDSISKISVLKHFSDHRSEPMTLTGICESLGRDEAVVFSEIEDLVGCGLIKEELGEAGLIEYQLTSDEKILHRIESLVEYLEDPKTRLEVIALILEIQTHSR